MMVVVQHCRGFVMEDYSPSAQGLAKLIYAATGFGHQAVVIFFVLSGYLVGGKVLRSWRRGETTALAAKRFFVDRFSRIFIVLWPALIVTAVIAAVAPEAIVLRDSHWVVGLGNVRSSSTLSVWAGAAVLLNELAVPSLPWNGPLWSLSFEWAYYVIAGAALVATLRTRSWFAIVVCAYAFVLIALSALNRPILLAMFTFWLAGAFSSSVRGLRLPWITLPFFFLALLSSRVTIVPLLQDGLVALATALLIADDSFRDSHPARRIGHELASFSFSLYAVHLPVLLLAISLIQSAGYLQQRLPPGAIAYSLVIGLLAFAYVFAWSFAQITERQTATLRAHILERLGIGKSTHTV